MTLYWLYDLPTWLCVLVVIAVLVMCGLAGLALMRGWVRRIPHVDHLHNASVGCFPAAATVFHRITLGPVSAGTRTSFSAASGKADAEGQVVAGLCPDTGFYPQACGLPGLLLFMVAGPDNPFRGKVRIGSEPLERVCKQLVQERRS